MSELFSYNQLPGALPVGLSVRVKNPDTDALLTIYNAAGGVITQSTFVTDASGDFKFGMGTAPTIFNVDIELGGLGTAADLSWNSGAMYPLDRIVVLGTKQLNALTNPDYITYNTSPTTSSTAQATVSWNSDELTLDLIQNGTTLQMGQEMQFPPIRNNTGSTLLNGTAVMATGTIGASGRITIAKMDASVASNAKFFIGILTEDVLPAGGGNTGDGKATVFGKVRKLNTTTWEEDNVLYLDPAVLGGLINVEPTYPDMSMAVGFVITKHATVGTIMVRVNNLDTNAFVAAGSTYQDSIILHTFAAEPKRNSEGNIHGELTSLITGDTLSTGVDIAGTNGISKLFIAAKAGSDFTGSFTVTGTVVDRDTGVESAGSEIIAVDVLTVDTTAGDANGNIRHDIVNGYMTDNWYTGAYTVSTTDLNLSDVDIYQMAFYQFGDESTVTLNTFDTTVKITNATADFAIHMYTVEKQTGNKFNVQIAAEALVASPTVTRSYRLKRGNLGIALDCTTDGIFVDVFFNGTSTYFDNFDLSIKAEITRTLT